MAIAHAAVVRIFFVAFFALLFAAPNPAGRVVEIDDMRGGVLPASARRDRAGGAAMT